MQAYGNQPRDVRNVGHHFCADRLRGLADAFEIDRARVGAGAADQKLRAAFFRDPLQLVVIDLLSFTIYAIIGDLVIKAGSVR